MTSSQTQGIMNALMASHSTLLPDLAFEVISAEDRYPPNRHMFADPARPNERTELIKATWTTRNTKLAEVPRLAILPTWSMEKTRDILDAKVAEHAKRKDLELTFDPVALSIMSLYTGKNQAGLTKTITQTKHDGTITGSVSKGKNPRVLKEGIFTDAAASLGAFHQKKRSSQTTLKLLLNKGRVNVELDAPQFIWNTANRWLTLEIPIPQSVLASLRGKPVATIIEAAWTDDLIITRVDPMDYEAYGISCQIHYR